LEKKTAACIKRCFEWSAFAQHASLPQLRTAWIYFGSDLSGQLSRTGLDHASHLLMEEFEVGKSDAWCQSWAALMF
jgi:hypothetical protein